VKVYVAFQNYQMGILGGNVLWEHRIFSQADAQYFQGIVFDQLLYLKVVEWLLGNGIVYIDHIHWFVIFC
jgi:hypothetical protein